jgi:hypothetical protein
MGAEVAKCLLRLGQVHGEKVAQKEYAVVAEGQGAVKWNVGRSLASPPREYCRELPRRQVPVPTEAKHPAAGTPGQVEYLRRVRFRAVDRCRQRRRP